MISKLKGFVEEIGDTWVDLDVQGVCYRLSCSSKTLMSLPGCGEAATLYTQMIVREDDMSLLGFQSADQRSLFHLLTSVQGVGTRVGLALFAIGSPEEIVHAIACEDKAFICRAEGIGPKLASRLLNELKDKVGSVLRASCAGPSSVARTSALSSFPEDAEGTASLPLSFSRDAVSRDAVSALLSLGYRFMDASAAVDYIMKNEPTCASIQDVIRLSLAKLSRS